MLQEFHWSWVQDQVAQSIDLWNRCAAPSRLNETRYTFTEQQKREIAFDREFRTVEREMKKAPRSKAARFETQNRITASLARFGANALKLEPEAIDLLTNSFLPAGSRFARLARQFDASLSIADVVQACRSAWTACGLQLLLGDRMEITSSILGYSLLYPYSDNYLDCVDVSAEAKLRFSGRFRARLRGHKLSAFDHREAAIWDMVELIEGQFPRLRFPQVFDSLLAIHQAQEESIAQLGGSSRCTDAKVLRITCAKGGTSVLADACMAHGWLSEEESQFAFQWGVLLQLGDDLQDIREDLQRGSVTLFTSAVTQDIPLDALVMQLLNFSESVAAEMDSLPNASRVLKDLMKMSWRSLIVGVVAESYQLFTPAFLDEAERMSPFRFDFLRKRRARFTSKQGLFVPLFDASLKGENDEQLLPNQRDFFSIQADDLSVEALAAAG